jgi:two-component sensor histidine kinase
MVTSLLKSQSSFLSDPNAIDAVAESQSRVHAMSLIHQKLYSSTDLSVIDMESYINDLVENWRDMARPDHAIVFDTQVDKVNLDVSQAMSVGLILNEVIVNAVKHAFTDIPHPFIRIWLRQGNDESIEVFVSDNGQGMPETQDPDQVKSFGFRLIRGLARDLDADLSIQNNNGVAYSFSFTKVSPRIHEIS